MLYSSAVDVGATGLSVLAAGSDLALASRGACAVSVAPGLVSDALAGAAFSVRGGFAVVASAAGAGAGALSVFGRGAVAVSALGAGAGAGAGCAAGFGVTTGSGAGLAWAVDGASAWGAAGLVSASLGRGGSVLVATAGSEALFCAVGCAAFCSATGPGAVSFGDSPPALCSLVAG